MTNESQRIQDFISHQQEQVLDQSLRDLNACPLNLLTQTLHRLKGTLGTYQFNELSDRLALVEKVAQSTKDISILNRAHLEAMNLILGEIREGVKK